MISSSSSFVIGSSDVISAVTPILKISDDDGRLTKKNEEKTSISFNSTYKYCASPFACANEIHSMKHRNLVKIYKQNGDALHVQHLADT